MFLKKRRKKEIDKEGKVTVTDPRMLVQPLQFCDSMISAVPSKAVQLRAWNASARL